MIHIIIGFCLAVSVYVVVNYIKTTLKKDSSKMIKDIMKEIRKDTVYTNVSYTPWSPFNAMSTTEPPFGVPFKTLSKDELYERAVEKLESFKINSDEFRDICKHLDKGELKEAEKKIFKL
jgi:hypothetical protein